MVPLVEVSTYSCGVFFLIDVLCFVKYIECEMGSRWAKFHMAQMTLFLRCPLVILWCSMESENFISLLITVYLF